MSYSILTIVLLASITLSSSLSNLHLHNEQNVFIRLYPTFAQLYRPVTIQSNSSESAEQQTSERYQFLFTTTEYSQISEDSLTILFANVTERTITYHSTPNFEEVGSRYFYRRDPKESEAVEIELVNSEDHLFREVRRPNRYFYLNSFDNLEYSKKIPVMPYYEVSFICNPLFTTDTQSPFLSYTDKNFQWTPRYTLELPKVDTEKQPIMYAYADIRNNGEHEIVIERAELVAGDIKLDERPLNFLREESSSGSGVDYTISAYKSDDSFIRPLGKQASGTYIYQVSVPPLFTLPPFTTKSIQFFQANVTLDSFHYYTSEFTPVNSNGKLFNAYNITSYNTFIPNGRILLRQEGEFIGQSILPDLAVGETYTMVLGYDADVSYRRQVKILEGDEDNDSVTYYVEYTFENYTPTRDVRIYFIESFRSFKDFQIKKISKSNINRNLEDLVSYGTELRADITIPRMNGRKTISYNVVMYKIKPIVNFRQQSKNQDRFY